MPGTVKCTSLVLALVLLGCTKQSRMELRADLGGREAKREYGLWLLSQGPVRDQPLGMAYLKKAAEAGDGKAMYHLGSILSSGGDSWSPAPEALTWFKKGAEAGDRPSMYVLANAYRYGYMAVDKDDALANHWFAEAAKARQPGEM